MTLWKTEDNSEIYYEYRDNRRPETLVLLHGLLGSVKGQWADFADFLSETHNLLLIDLRNHGRSNNKDTRLKLDTMASDVVGLVKYLKISSAHLTGYSLGGNIGLLAVLQDPGLFASLNIISTKYYWKDAEAKRMQQQVDPDTIGNKAPTYATQLAQEHGAANWRGLARHTSDIIAFMASNPLSKEELAKIEIPVMVTIGDRDNLIPLPEAYKLSRQLPKGGLLVLPNTGHAFNTLPFQYLMPIMQQFHLSK